MNVVDAVLTGVIAAGCGIGACILTAVARLCIKSCARRCGLREDTLLHRILHRIADEGTSPTAPVVVNIIKDDSDSEEEAKLPIHRSASTPNLALGTGAQLVRTSTTVTSFYQLADESKQAHQSRIAQDVDYTDSIPYMDALDTPYVEPAASNNHLNVPGNTFTAAHRSPLLEHRAKPVLN